MLHLIVAIDGQRIALPAAAVESVIELDALTPVPRGPAHLLGLMALRSRVLTVIDSRAAIGLPPAPPSERREAVVVEVEGAAYALTVDALDDVAEADGPPEPVRGTLAAAWAGVADAVVPVGGALALRINPAALIAGR
ncbi:chemotaxis protein CheW [Sphingomonas jatrophae]|uniref:Purine-binding chemotaxis protein CheW n=1 Tax=Sphingomonas jatrophae TaxID=1166337 RepID=A0A1I6L103_9SPHN|nr:chemotaxis protein CheW [Sphingomonas jatrophae]SFR97134.1 purine-binding chemotaxis protein CheW [Sphingomonas jatrophae]